MRADTFLLGELSIISGVLKPSDAINAFVEAAEAPEGRAAIEAERIRRGCIARRRFPITPLIPGTDHCG